MFFKEYNWFFLKKIILSQHIMIGNPSSEKENIIKDIRNVFKLKKELN